VHNPFVGHPVSVGPDVVGALKHVRALDEERYQTQGCRASGWRDPWMFFTFSMLLTAPAPFLLLLQGGIQLTGVFWSAATTALARCVKDFCNGVMWKLDCDLSMVSLASGKASVTSGQDPKIRVMNYALGSSLDRLLQRWYIIMQGTCRSCGYWTAAPPSA